ncbi:MAG: divalent-cation tolerance protein CutA [Gammaproteobacteria bacterium]
MPYRLIVNTCPDDATAERIARLLVERKLAACVNIVPGLTSVYRWQGNIETAGECLLLIKTEAELYSAVEACIRSHHPYELPEIIALSIEQSLPEYLQWIDSCLTSS